MDLCPVESYMDVRCGVYRSDATIRRYYLSTR